LIVLVIWVLILARKIIVANGIFQRGPRAERGFILLGEFGLRCRLGDDSPEQITRRLRAELGKTFVGITQLVSDSTSMGIHLDFG